MIVKNKISIEEVKDFFRFELNKLDESLGKVTFNTTDDSLVFDAIALEILNVENMMPNVEYTIKNSYLPNKFESYIDSLDIDLIQRDSSFTYQDIPDQEILFKLERLENKIIINVISFKLLLETQEKLRYLNTLLQSSNQFFTISTWWKDYDMYEDYFYQTDEGVKILGLEPSKDKLYKVAEFQKVREKAARSSDFYFECINSEKEAFLKVFSNETDYFGGRTPAFTVDNEEVWVEAYGKCILRYADGSPRFFVALDIYLSDFLEKSNQLEMLYSLINNGLSHSNVGIWYYHKHHDQPRYEFTNSYKKLMDVDESLDCNDVTVIFDEHFNEVIRKTPEYQDYLVDWHNTHKEVFKGDKESYVSLIPNNSSLDKPHWIEIRGNVLERHQNGDVKLFVGVNVDVTETVQRNLELERLREENERLQLAEKLAIKAGNVLVWYQDFDTEGYERNIYGNEMWTNKLGISRNEMGLFRISELRKTIVKTDDESKGIARSFIEKLNQIYTNEINSIQDVLVKHKNTKTGEVFYFEHNVEIEQRYENGDVKLIGGFMRDVTEQVKKQKKIAYLANNDTLTGLRNRNYFDTFISSGALPSSYSILLFDLDGLKLINDAFGHLEGDRAIKQVAKFLIDVFDENLFISRIGGDEFLVLTLEIDPVLITDKANEFERKLKEYNKISSIEINVSKGGYVVEDDDVDFEKAFAHAENLMYRRKLTNRSSRKSKVLDSIIETLNQKTEETKEHSDRIEEYCINISKQLGITRASDLEDLRLLAKVHDVGKITIPDRILNKPGRLTDDEFEEIKKHPESGYKIIKNITDSDFVCEAVLSHHEKFDGTGYPQGLQGKEIPLFARIISVADAFDAMTNDRVYHKAIPQKDAIKEIISCSGTHFDPDIVQAFLKSNFNVDLE